MSFITADQLLAHAVGDYILQSDWMAQQKTKSGVAATVHATLYSLVFAAAFHPSLTAWAVIYATHYLIDRYRLARFVVAFKNEWLRPIPHSVSEVDFDPATGSPRERPAFLSVWLLIIADNVMHVAINGAALRWL